MNYAWLTRKPVKATLFSSIFPETRETCVKRVHVQLSQTKERLLSYNHEQVIVDDMQAKKLPS
jgi:hypothetical protein